LQILLPIFYQDIDNFCFASVNNTTVRNDKSIVQCFRCLYHRAPMATRHKSIGQARQMANTEACMSVYRFSRLLPFNIFTFDLGICLNKSNP
jgi:hypothetical protein